MSSCGPLSCFHTGTKTNRKGRILLTTRFLDLVDEGLCIAPLSCATVDLVEAQEESDNPFKTAHWDGILGQIAQSIARDIFQTRITTKRPILEVQEVRIVNGRVLRKPENGRSGEWSFDPANPYVIKIKEKIVQIFQKKYNFTKDQIEILDSLKNNKSLLIEEFTSIVDWNEYIIDEKIKIILNKLDLKFKQLGQPLRLILSGSSDGPSISKLMEIIGKDQSLEKLKHNW